MIIMFIIIIITIIIISHPLGRGRPLETRPLERSQMGVHASTYVMAKYNILDHNILCYITLYVLHVILVIVCRAIYIYI